MVQRSGQMGVPVIAAGDEIIVGFDRRRLMQVAQRYAAGAAAAEGPRLGLLARDEPDGRVLVGGARPGSVAATAGFQPGDVIETWQGQAVGSMADIERLVGHLRQGQVVDIRVRRGETTTTLRFTW